MSGGNAVLINPFTGQPYVAGGNQDAAGNTVVAQTPSSSASNALTPATGTNTTSLVVKAAAGNFYGASITAGATAGLLIAYNSAAAPGAGANLTQNLILGVVAVAANGSAAIGDFSIPDRFSAGVTLLFSTTLATFTAPANPAQFMRGRAF